MDKDKINIDQYFKNSLQNVEGNADDAMFDEIKEKVDASKVSIDDYFKNAVAGFEINADDISFDSIKNKINTPKVSVDTYFKEALLDYNSNAGGIPFIEIQNKLDRERVIDEHFKSALQNYEGQAHDQEFAVIRNRVLQLQQKENRKRYAWLLLLLLIPAGVIGYNYFNRNTTPVVSEAVTTEKQVKENNTPAISNNSEVGKIANSNAGNSSNAANQNSNHSNNTPRVNPVNNPTSNNSNANNHNNSTNPTVVNPTPSSTNGNDIVKGDEPNKDKGDLTNSKDENKNSQDAKGKEGDAVKANDPSTVKDASTASTAKPTGVTIHKPKPNKFTLEVFGAAALNDRYLHADSRSAQYFATRTASDKQTTKLNFGADLYKSVGKFNFGFGLHENEFGQQGAYNITKNLSDSFPLYGTNGAIKGYFHYNFRDSSYSYSYNNSFTSVEIPFHFTYRICSTMKWDFETGAGVLLSYIAGAKGAMPNANSSEVIQLKDAMGMINRFGSAVTVNMKFHYNLTQHWQLGSDIYLKSNITSLYKQSTGITELPYSFGWRWGIGYKF